MSRIQTEENTPAITQLTLHRVSKSLGVAFADGQEFDLPCEYLRVFSPSAEVRGHSGGEGTLVAGKDGVTITRIEPVGQYAVRLHFSDGHNTGLFTWPLLYQLGIDKEANWASYLARLEAAGESRSG